MGKMSPGMRMLAINQARRQREEGDRYGAPDREQGADRRRGAYSYSINGTEYRGGADEKTMPMHGEMHRDKPREETYTGREEETVHPLTKEKAEKWVKHMRNADGSMGGKWRMEEVQQVARNFGIQDGQEMTDFYAIMNAIRSDFGEVARQFGVDKTDFYAAMAKAWIHDKDAVENKAAMYYKCIVAKDEKEE